MKASGDNRYLAVFCRLATKTGLSPGALCAGHRDPFMVVVCAAALAFESGREYDEPAVNGRLRAWLAGPGAMLATDHVALRRWLVDCAVLDRDGYGHRYRRCEPSGDWAVVMSALAGIDLDAEAKTARAADAAQRAKRKTAWFARASRDGAPGE